MAARLGKGYLWRFALGVFVVVAMLVPASPGVAASSNSPSPDPSSLPPAQQINPNAAPPAITATRLADGRLAANNRIIVTFRAGVTPGEQTAAHGAVGRAVARGTAPRPLVQLGAQSQTVDITGASSVEAAVAAYRTDARVADATPDYVNFATETPNDPSFSTEYGLTKINAPAAWDITHGSSAIKIAILDCGVHSSHPDLAGKVVLEKDIAGANGTTGFYGTDDLCNHGTHVAGTAAAATNNSVGVAGVGYNTNLMNGNVFVNDPTYGYVAYDSDLDKGIRWAADNGAKVISMSLGAYISTCSQQSAVDYAWGKGVVIVAAAGNEYANNIDSPANCTHVVSVAATDQNDAKPAFSNYGSRVTVAAPGVNVYSTLNPNVNSGTSYGYETGTSMSTPHVSGLAALIWATSYGTGAQAVVDRICTTADHITGTGTNWQCGRINAGAAVLGTTPLAVSAVSPAMGGTGGSTVVTLTGIGFDSNTRVAFGGTDATNLTVVNSTTLRVTTPLHAAGVVSVTVRSTGGQMGSTSGSFTYVTPAAAPTPRPTISPASAPTPAPPTRPPAATLPAPTPTPMPQPGRRL